MLENHESTDHTEEADSNPDHEGARRRRSIVKPAIVVGAITVASWVIPKIVTVAKAAGLSPGVT